VKTADTHRIVIHPPGDQARLARKAFSFSRTPALAYEPAWQAGSLTGVACVGCGESSSQYPGPDPAAMNSRARIFASIRQVPRGMVSTYGAIGRAAGLTRGARQVAAALRLGVGLPWHRILGAGGQIRLRGPSAFEQRMRLEAEGVRFRGKRVDMARHEYRFPRTSLPKALSNPSRSGKK